MRPARNRSQTVTRMNQFFDRNAFEVYAILLDEGEHFAHGLSLRSINPNRTQGTPPVTEDVQRFVNNLLDRMVPARV